jgi:hypothetical protein
MLPRMIRPLIPTVAVLLGTLAAPALAAPPPGDWTFIRKDRLTHYACKAKTKADGWRVRTASTGKDRDVGVYAAIARGSNRNLVSERSVERWERGYVRTTLRGARSSDRLWVQGAYYGPAEPWSDGFRVSRIKRCASVA